MNHLIGQGHPDTQRREGCAAVWAITAQVYAGNTVLLVMSHGSVRQDDRWPKKGICHPVSASEAVTPQF